MTIQLLYLSKSAGVVSDDDLSEILRTSRINNLSRSVTGVLLYSRGTFFQVLEGPRDTVHDLYEIIEKDDRHLNSWILRESTVTQRDFSSWSMGFRPVSDDIVLRDSFFELTEDNAMAAARVGASDRILRRLKEFAGMKRTEAAH